MNYIVSIDNTIWSPFGIVLHLNIVVGTFFYLLNYVTVPASWSIWKTKVTDIKYEKCSFYVQFLRQRCNLNNPISIKSVNHFIFKLQTCNVRYTKNCHSSVQYVLRWPKIVEDDPRKILSINWWYATLWSWLVWRQVWSNHFAICRATALQSSRHFSQMEGGYTNLLTRF